MEIRCRNTSEGWQVCKPYRFFQREGITFYYVKTKEGVYIIEESTGRSIGQNFCATNMASTNFNKVWRNHGKNGFLEAMSRVKKAPRVSCK